MFAAELVSQDMCFVSFEHNYSFLSGWAKIYIDENQRHFFVCSFVVQNLHVFLQRDCFFFGVVLERGSLVQYFFFVLFVCLVSVERRLLLMSRLRQRSIPSRTFFHLLNINKSHFFLLKGELFLQSMRTLRLLTFIQ